MDWTTIILLPHMSSFWSQGEKKKKVLFFIYFKNQQLKFTVRTAAMFCPLFYLGQ